jgi:hypothetical protein
MTVRTSVEGARGCGYRKPGGYYLVAPQLSEPCSLLPMPLDRCPHCGQGIGPARGFTWITPTVILPAQVHRTPSHNEICPLGRPLMRMDGLNRTTAEDVENDPTLYHRMGDRAGLIWVGGLFYPTAESFMEEAARMGISRRVQRPPRGFKVGEDWIVLGHAKAIKTPGIEVEGTVQEWEFSPGVLTVFKPTALEYIVKGSETDEELEALEKRGISPVKVIRDVDA